MTAYTRRARFPHLDPHLVPAAAWRELPIEGFELGLLEENYRGMMIRKFKAYSPSSCPRHVWMRTERGPWVCEHCPEWRWTL